MRKHIHLMSFPSLLILLLSSLLSSALLTSCKESPKTIVGTIDLASEYRSTLSPSAAVYIIARKAGQTSGPPIAVKQFTQPLVFPIEFQLSALDVMLPGGALENEMTVTARIAQTGSATPVQAGDIEGTGTPNPVTLGSRTLKILLNKKLVK